MPVKFKLIKLDWLHNHCGDTSKLNASVQILLTSLTFGERQQKLVLQAGLLIEKKSRKQICKSGSRITPLETTQNFGEETFGKSKFDFISRERNVDWVADGGQTTSTVCSRCGKMLALKEMLCKFLSSGQWTCGFMPKPVEGNWVVDKKLESWILRQSSA